MTAKASIRPRTTCSNESGGGGNGLGNMRNRAAEIPGTLTITSAPGQGTTVELRFVPGEGKRSLEPMTPGADGDAQPR
jgi:signal transduction histidine kinase